MKIEFSRFPNQGYGWFPHKNGKGRKAPLNQNGARFGGGWNYELGIRISGRSVLLCVIFGMIKIQFRGD